MDKMSLLLLGLAFVPFFLGKFRNHGSIKLCICSVCLAFCGIRNTDMSLSHESELATVVFYFVIYFIFSFLGMGLVFLGSAAEADMRADLLRSVGTKDIDNPWLY